VADGAAPEPAVLALRLDDVGAASKRHEVYGRTRIPLGPVALPFPGNFLFLKYLAPIKRWGPYPELGPGHWEAILDDLGAARARLTVAVTAGWVEDDARIVPFPVKFPDQARLLRAGHRAGLLEIANHGYTHCVVQDGLYRPRLFRGNRPYHREFYEWLPERVHREHLLAAQDILGSWFGERPVTLVPPGNVLAPQAVAAAAALGIRYISCHGPARPTAADGIVFVDASRVLAMHDRDIVLGPPGFLPGLLASRAGARWVTVRELGGLRA
jgi:peptidoglycan/xylan/chitin deacetylase (PgdA/CDA1 family)